MIELKINERPVINFAKSVYNVAHLEDEYATQIMDRSQTIDKEIVGALINQGIMSYSGRNPQPALDKDGNFRTTDLDLLSFLSPLAVRGAVIEIPKYRNRRKIIKKEGERKIGTNQFGPITSLVSNKDVFSFSVKIHDKTIVVKDGETGKESMGEFRNYMIVDCDGHLYDGWNQITWDPNAEENAFLSEKNLWTGNSIFFEYFVHPNRWQSVYGAPHLLKKMLISRLNDEAKFYRSEMKRLNEAGFELPEGEKKKFRKIIASGESKKIQVETMEMKLMIPEFLGNYENVETSQKGLVEAYRRQKLLTYTFKPALQFVVRANEAAFLKFGFRSNGQEKIAHWMKNCKWKSWRKTTRSAIYNKLVLSSSVALLYRKKTKTEHISV